MGHFSLLFSQIGLKSSGVVVAANGASQALRSTANLLCDLTADEVQIQSGIDTASASETTLSEATFETAAPVNVITGTRLSGDSLFNTIIKAESDFADGEELIGDNTGSNVVIEKMTLDLNGDIQTTGSKHTIDFSNVNRLLLQELFIKNQDNRGILFTSCEDGIINNIFVDNSGLSTQQNGQVISIGGTSKNIIANNLVMNKANTSEATGGTGRAFTLSGTADPTETVHNIILNNLIAELGSSTSDGVNITNDCDRIIYSNVIIDAGKEGDNGSSLTGRDILLSNMIYSEVNRNGISLLNGQDGNASHLSIMGVIARNGGQENVSDKENGIVVNAAWTNFTILGLHAYDDQSTKTQEWGIKLNAADNDNYIIAANNLIGNVNAVGLDDGSTSSPTKQVFGNLPFTANFDFHMDGVNAVSTMAHSGGHLDFGATPGTAGTIRLTNAQFISWRNAAADNNIDFSVDANDDFLFRIDGTKEMSINGSSVDLEDNRLHLANGKAIRWANVAGRAITNTVTGFVFDVEAGDTYSLDVAGVPEYIFDSALFTFGEANDIVFGTTTGTKIGTGTTQKLSFWNATPVVQPGHIANPTDLATAIVAIDAILADLAELGLQAAS